MFGRGLMAAGQVRGPAAKFPADIPIGAGCLSSCRRPSAEQAADDRTGPDSPHRAGSSTAQARIRESGFKDEDGLQPWLIGHFNRWLAGARRARWLPASPPGPRAPGPPGPAGGDRSPQGDPHVLVGDESGLPVGAGRRLIGWDEILAGGLAESAAVAYRRWYTDGIAAAETGHKMVTCPQQEVHLDHVQSHDAREPVPFGRVHTPEDVYRFEPVPPRPAGTAHAAQAIGKSSKIAREWTTWRFPGWSRSRKWLRRTCRLPTNATSTTSSAG
ncbi:family 20 glycosylhydrolase [Nonomuraea jabiensis]|uniref:family 20 glycosylhydrolase n=1 Tax=Nonomuraea jabiensis TaxID=882448 RepID=UPI003448A238